MYAEMLHYHPQADATVHVTSLPQPKARTMPAHAA